MAFLPNSSSGLTIYLDKKALDKIKDDADTQDSSVAILKKHYNLDKKDKTRE